MKPRHASAVLNSLILDAWALVFGAQTPLRIPERAHHPRRDVLLATGLLNSDIFLRLAVEALLR